MFQILDVCVKYISGSTGTTGIPSELAYIIGLLYRGIQIVIPVLLVLWGMLDLGKAVMAQKEEEIKKGQQTFIKRIVAAAIVFFVFTIVELLVGLVAEDSENIGKCINSIIKCDSRSCKDRTPQDE